MALFKRRIRQVDTRDTERALEEIVRQINSMQDDLEQWYLQEKQGKRKGGGN